MTLDVLVSIVVFFIQWIFIFYDNSLMIGSENAMATAVTLFCAITITAISSMLFGILVAVLGVIAGYIVIIIGLAYIVAKYCERKREG